MKTGTDRKKTEYLAKDSITSIHHIVPFIAFFEITMIIVQLTSLSAAYTSGKLGIWYLSGYLVLLCASVFLFLISLVRRVQKSPVLVSILTSIYCVILLGCALLFTYLDARQKLESVVIYAAMISLVPLLGMMNTVMTLLLEIAGTVLMMVIALHYYQNLSAFQVNFLVFAIITLVLGLSYRRVRMRGYERQIELEELSDLRRKYAYIDELTNLQNHRAFSEKMDAIEKERPEGGFTIWIFDVNSLKQVNDTLGHTAGDELIRGAADCIALAIGSRDKVYRIGGDEFAVIDPDHQPTEEIEERFFRICGAWHGQLVKSLTVSCGAASSLEAPDLHISELERKADQRMYESKKQYYVNHTEYR